MEETEAESEHNINKITCDTSFQSLIQNKYVSKINNSVYYDSDEQVDMISNSNKPVDPSSNPNIETHIINKIRKLSVRPILFNPSAIGVIGQDLVTNVRENSRVELSLKSLSPLNAMSSKEVVTGAACNIAQVDRNIRKNCKPVDMSISNPSRVGTPEVNIYAFSKIRGSISIFTKWSRNIETLYTSVDGSTTQENNSDLSYI